MLGTIAIVALIATISNANVLEYTENLALNISYVHPESEKVDNAELYNAEGLMKLYQLPMPLEESGFLLVAGADPELCENCTKILAINVTHVYPNIYAELMFLKFDYVLKGNFSNPEDPPVIEQPKLQLNFKDSVNDQRLVVVEIPIYEAPSEFTDEAAQRKWAADNKVGILAPIDEILNEIEKEKEWMGDFKWLNDLFSYGLWENGTKDGTNFTTRPLVLSKEVLHKAVQVLMQEVMEKTYFFAYFEG